MFLISCLLSILALPSTFAPRAEDERKPLDVKIGGDAHKRYLLHTPDEKVKAPKDGWKVLVVLPGGDGSANFAPFVGRIRANVLDDEWILVQLVAPVWDEKQAKELVWPTKKSPWPKMEFSCEELFDAVLVDVEKTRKLDARYVFTLGWSSSGPLVYTLGLQKTTRVTGSFVAMSVFKPDALPALENAQGRAFYLLHSPEDWIPIDQAREALAALKQHGASVELATYAGGHGWHGDVFGTIRTGIEALERAAGASKPPKAKKSPTTGEKRKDG